MTATTTSHWYEIFELPYKAHQWSDEKIAELATNGLGMSTNAALVASLPRERRESILRLIGLGYRPTFAATFAIAAYTLHNEGPAELDELLSNGLAPDASRSWLSPFVLSLAQSGDQDRAKRLADQVNIGHSWTLLFGGGCPPVTEEVGEAWATWDPDSHPAQLLVKRDNWDAKMKAFTMAHFMRGRYFAKSWNFKAPTLTEFATALLNTEGRREDGDRIRGVSDDALINYSEYAAFWAIAKVLDRDDLPAGNVGSVQLTHEELDRVVAAVNLLQKGDWLTLSRAREGLAVLIGEEALAVWMRTQS